jgi:sigma-E factor negative regulatory protein RseC
MIETGQVVRIKGRQVVVRIQRKEACAHCGMCQDAGKGMEITLDNPLGAVAGDRVEVSMGDRMVWKASVIVYAIPLLFLLAGAALGYVLSPLLGAADRDLTAALCGIGSTALSYILVRSIDKKVSDKQGYRPRITRILDEEE